MAVRLVILESAVQTILVTLQDAGFNPVPVALRGRVCAEYEIECATHDMIAVANAARDAIQRTGIELNWGDIIATYDPVTGLASVVVR